MDAAARCGIPADWLVRAKHNRITGSGEKLWGRLARRDPLGEVELWLPAAPGRPARGVRQPLQVQSVTLPARQGALAVTVTAILAQEAPPRGSAGYQLALVDEADGGNARTGCRINRLVPSSLAARNFFPHLEVRLPSRSPATGHPGTAGTGFSDLVDHRVAYPAPRVQLKV